MNLRIFIRAGWFGVRTSVEEEGLPFLHPSRPNLGPIHLPCSGYRSSFSGVKLSGRGVDHPPPSNSKVKNEWSITLTPPLCLREIIQEGYLSTSGVSKKET